jgi:AcrR family transcriptional regulator
MGKVLANRPATKRVSAIGKRRVAAEVESSEAYKARRLEIAAAAARVFNRVGLQRATLRAVADEMGVDRASLYYYVSSKESLFDEVVRTVVERNLEMTRKIAASKVSPRRKLRDLICTLMSSYGEHYPLLYIYLRENLSHVDPSRAAWSSEMREINRQTTEALIEIIEQGYADKSFRNVGSPRVVAYGVFGIVGWTHRWFRPGESDVSAEEIGKTYAEMILAGLESPY